MAPKPMSQSANSRILGHEQGVLPKEPSFHTLLKNSERSTAMIKIYEQGALSF